MKRLFSPRTYFIIATLLTLVLLIGSTILQQIVFKADQEQTSLVLFPTSFRSAEGGVFDLEIRSASDDTVFATGMQLTLRFDRQTVGYQEAIPAVGWETLAATSEPGLIRWVLAPAVRSGPIAELAPTTSLGVIRFRALQPGVTSVTFDQEQTILSAIDPVDGNFVYNAAATIQSSAGTIVPAGEGAATFPETEISTLTAPESAVGPLFGSQRILSTYVAAGREDAVTFITLGYPGRVSIEFGTTPQLGNRVESLRESVSHVLQLSSLEAGRTYYYRVIGEQTDEQSRIIGAVRSFSLPMASATGSVASQATSEVIVFPSRTADKASVYVFPRDETGAAVALEQLSLQASDGVVVGEPKHRNDYVVFDLESQLTAKEVVTVKPTTGQGQELGSASVIFDPNYQPPQRLGAATELVLAWNQKSIAFLFGGLLLLLLIGFLFVRLVRAR